MAKIILPLSLWHSFSLMVKENGYLIFGCFSDEKCFFFTRELVIYGLSPEAVEQILLKSTWKRPLRRIPNMALNVCSVQTPRMRFIIIVHPCMKLIIFLGHLVFLEILCIAYFFFYIICIFVSNRKVKWTFILSY